MARVAGENISPDDYKAEFDRVLERAKQETGRDVTSAEAREQGIDNAVLERMVGERSLAALTRSLGLMPSEAALQREISNIDAFKDPSTGQFSTEFYAETLQRNRLTPTRFEAQLRTDMARGMLFTAATSGMRAPGPLCPPDPRCGNRAAHGIDHRGPGGPCWQHWRANPGRYPGDLYREPAPPDPTRDPQPDAGGCKPR